MKKNYTLSDGVYVSEAFSIGFNYSDGDEKENHLSLFLKNATDLTTGSQELMSGVIDWPSLYHLSPKRADLLRPLSGLLKDRSILEIGSGCGAITRYLGEVSGARITALEGSYRRATITRSRCKDLDNVKVFCDNFQDFETEEKFDIITLIGVLEYSNLYIQAEDPPEAMLRRVCSFLKPGGHIVIAIENKLGLKYLAGAPEDHQGKPFFGIENKYSRSTSVTFGKIELKKILSKCGFADTSFLYPFPDYKLPSVILTEKGVQDNEFTAEEILSEKLEYFQYDTYTNIFSTTLAAETFARNELLSHFSNSFLVVASPDKQPWYIDDEVLAYTYSTYRKKEFCKENIFVKTHPEAINVVKNRLYDHPYLPDQPIRHIVENEKYHKGALLFSQLVRLTSQTDWSISDLYSWAQTYYTILCKYAIFRENGPILEGKYIDLVPFNIILTDDLKPYVFDQEWAAEDDLPLYYVFFRGIRFSLSCISFFSVPSPGTPLNLLELSQAIINSIMPFTEEMFQECLTREIRYFSPVNFSQPQSFDCGNIPIRGDIHAEKNIRTELQSLRNEMGRLRQELEQARTRERAETGRLRDELYEIRQQESTEKQRLQFLEQQNDWFVRTYENRSMFGLMREMFRHIGRRSS